MEATRTLFRVTEVELIYRNKTLPEYRIKVSDSATAHNVLRQAWDDNKIQLVEQFKIILLDNQNNCLGISDVATGGMTSCIVDAKVIYGTALKGKANKLILAHNHPSGILQPSEADLCTTNKLVQGGNLLDIAVVDHLIMTANDYYSMADYGLMP